MRPVLVRAVATGSRAAAPSSVAFCTIEVGGVALERREGEPDVRAGMLRAQLAVLGDEAGAVAAQGGDARLPFAVAPVEQHDGRAGGAAHHVRQVVRLGGCGSDFGALGQRRRDEQAD